MKKNTISILSLLFLSVNGYCATISIAPWISSNDVSIAHLESQRSTIQNVINGNIEGGNQNIKAGSITSSDLATAVNIVTFRNEAFNDFTYSGMLPPTSASLSSTITAGISYVNGVRIETAATAHTFTASKDTYLYINAGGYFDYVEVANGAAAPATPANDLLLAVVVSNGTAITSVTDSRTTSIQITANGSNFAQDYRNGGLVVRDSTTAMHIEPGQIAIGSSYYTTTADSSSRSTATLGNWIEGSVPNLNNLKFYIYAYNNSGTGYDFKYASAEPLYSDSSSNTNGTLRYYTSGGTTYRALAWISADGTGAIQTWNYSQLADTGAVNQVSKTPGAYASLGSVTFPDDDTIPQNTEGNLAIAVPFRPTNTNDTLHIEATFYGSAVTAPLGVSLCVLGTSNCLMAIQGSSAEGNEISTQHLSYSYKPATTSIINFQLRAGSAGAAACYMNGVAGAEKLGGVGGSNLTITEENS